MNEAARQAAARSDQQRYRKERWTPMTARQTISTVLLAGLAITFSACGDRETGQGSGGNSSSANTKPQPEEPKVAEGWGELTLRFVYDGTAPTPRKLPLSGADAPHCAKHAPLDESLLVDAGGGLANVIVYLRPGSGDTVKVHPDYEQLAGQPVKLTNKQCAFTPHVLTLWTRRPLVVSNDDTLGHNTKADLTINDAFNEQISPGKSITKHMSRSERRPVKFVCNSHPWMSGYLLVRDNPYMGVSATDGTLTIRNIPSGHWKFGVWHERFGNLVEVEQDGKHVLWSKGIVKLTIQPGKSNPIVIKVNPKHYGL